MNRVLSLLIGCSAWVAAASVKVSVGVGDELPFVRPADAVARLRAEVKAVASEGTISFTVRNVLGGETKTVRALSFMDGRATVKVLDAPLKKGAYDVAWSCRAGSETATGSQRIAVCDDVGPSEGRNGEFLFGTHAHLQCCRSPQEEELEVRAAARAGFTVMRIDLAWCAMERQPGDYDWSGSDRRVALLEKYGIRPQALVGLAPDWAVKRDWVYERPERGPCGNKLPEPALWKGFLEKMAAHFGTRIPFYELYNEPDLIGFGNFTVDDYVESFNAGARGVHAGCPTAKVLTGGIACWRVTVDTKRDFLPRGVLGTAQDFDILAIHEHGEPKGLFRTLDAHWLPLLKANGIRKPIWPNETSEDALRGEAAQAACYFQKALFSWSRGCCAHNWYKVRESGRDLAGTRRVYGLLSRDFEPLAAYPAVAGTTSLYRDAHFVREIPNDDMELLLFAKGQGLVLAGWPHKPGCARPPRPVKILTDASEAVFVDLMGNPRALSLVDGTIVFDTGRFVGSLVLRQATRAEAIATPPLPSRTPLKIRVPEGKFPSSPQLVLDRPEQYVSFAGFNPATDHLMWRGPDDLSARYWFRRDGDTLTVRADVTDDVTHFSTTEAPHAGDVMALAFMVDGRRHFCWVKSADGHAYRHTFSLAELGYAPGKHLLFNTRVWDNDDGIVAEGAIGLSEDIMVGERLEEWAELTFK